MGDQPVTIRTTFMDPDDEWNKLMSGANALFGVRKVFLSTSEPSQAVATPDGNLGLWVRLNPFEALRMHSALEHAVCPELAEDYDDSNEDHLDSSVYHDMAVHYLAEQMQRFLVPMRGAFLELGWDELLESEDGDV